jgi:hypothetical protein
MKQFIVITAVMITSLHTKANTAPAVTMDRSNIFSLVLNTPLSDVKEKTVPVLMKMDRVTDHPINLVKPLWTRFESWYGWVGLFNSTYQNYFDESEEKMDELREVFKKAIRGDQKTLDKYFHKKVKKFAGGIILRQLTWVIQDPREDGLISPEEADDIIDRLEGKIVPSIWDSGKYASGRFDVINGELEEDTWDPGREEELILFLDGKSSKPLFSGYCANTVILLPKKPIKPRTPYEEDRPEPEPVVVRKKIQQPVSDGGIDNSNDIDIDIKIDNRGREAEQQQVQYVPQKKGNGLVTFLGGVATGVVGTWIIDQLTGRRYQVQGNYQLGRNEQWWYPDQNYNPHYDPPQPRTRNYNNGPANSQVPLTAQQIRDQQRGQTRSQSNGQRQLTTQDLIELERQEIQMREELERRRRGF